ncbi:chemotaxis protein CheA [Clostridium sp. YIM B02505]|uniref:Chemotaxis protein CheA n=1 Tax=Clostridium yunnanense TaxID=2800325 RepID=A0ABS1EMC0_9CLOT|nr:chemotaxis protein CheA [Clostridium yunnanense]MBK1810475.1 chemotaxis protein CheA [Clostridium yunnanense]
MSDLNTNESMIELYLFETSQLMEQLEQLVIYSERNSTYSKNDINEIFRIMHTIKGSSAMMLYDDISRVAHAIEDLFYFIREEKNGNIDFDMLSNIVLDGVDFIKVELEKVKNGDTADGLANELIEKVENFLYILKQDGCSPKNEQQKSKDQNIQAKIEEKVIINLSGKNKFKAILNFEEGCEMEDFRASMVIDDLKQITEEYHTVPENIDENPDASAIIREQGFTVIFTTDNCYDEMKNFFMKTILLKSLELTQINNEIEQDNNFGKEETLKEIVIENTSNLIQQESGMKSKSKKETNKDNQVVSSQNMISVNVSKLDKLMDLIGEMVIAEAMVTQNPDLKDLQLDNFKKAARQLHKITSELQDTVMSIRMLPLASTFQKMYRVVRDMNKKLNKQVQLEVLGEETEVDKNIIEHISDPIMHLIRNSIDHGIETDDERKEKGKTESAKVTLEAKNLGGDVLILVKDNGRGLDKDKILEKAKKSGILYKNANEMTEKEIYGLILLPGFSTKESVSEFSGRGVGMDVVSKNIEAIGGSITIESTQGLGTIIILKIPLTLAIIDGMNVVVGKAQYTIPTASIKESFRAKEKDLITDPDGNEMIMVRGECYPIMRIHEIYKVKTEITNILEGIVLMIESEGKTICIFVDGLIGEQQVVVKALPKYITNIKKIKGLTGCALLGDGSISLILDVAGLIKYNC